MRCIRIFCGIFWLSYLSVGAHAEGNCPSGYYPIGGGATLGCAPIPGNGDSGAGGGGGPEWQSFSDLPPVWQDRWGAMATDEPRGVLGAVTGYHSEQAAQLAALHDCKAKGGINCTLANSYRNGCTALTVSDLNSYSGANATKDIVVSNGMRACIKDGNKNCRTYYAACSPPVRIR